MAKNSCGGSCGGCLGLFFVVIVLGSAASIIDALGPLLLIAAALVAVYVALAMANSRSSLRQWQRFVESMTSRTAYVVLDVETSGLKPAQGAEIVQFAVSVYNDQHERQGSYSGLVKPRNGVGPTEIHGITSSAVRFAPRIEAYAPQLRMLLDDTIVVAHNADFDVEFIRAALVSPFSSGASPRFRIIDTLALARQHLTGMSNYTLSTCVDAVGLDARQAPGRGAHDAEFDVWCCAGILHAIVREHELDINDIAKWG